MFDTLNLSVSILYTFDYMELRYGTLLLLLEGDTVILYTQTYMANADGLEIKRVVAFNCEFIYTSKYGGNKMEAISLKELCSYLSISMATGRNWIRLGKISPEEYRKNQPFFSRSYSENLRISIESGENSALKSRRNKKYVFGSFLYQDYVSENSKNLQVIQDLLEEIETAKIDITEEYLRAIIAECALQLLSQRFGIIHNHCVYLLKKYLDGNFAMGQYDPLIEDVIKMCDMETFKKVSGTSLFQFQYVYEESEDIIGLLYISCKNIANRKAIGAYYTPTHVAKKLIKNISECNHFHETARILDPCCGTGNFLLQLPNASVDHIFGIDIDELSVEITRINMALKFPGSPVKVLYKNFQVADYFHYKDTGFDYIIGNPPWGFDYSEEDKKALRAAFDTARGKTVESYDLFVEHSLKKLNQNGVLSFVLPEAILNVKMHQPVRKMLLTGNQIQVIDYLGEVFDKVHCPCVILQLKRNNALFRTVGMRVKTRDTSFIIETERKVSAEYFNFIIRDEEYSILQKILKTPNCAYLRDHAVFALGLVTGNNKKYISERQEPGYEIVLKGADIYKYRMIANKNYISFQPEDFQQVAPVKYYRASEKLLYRFICNQLVFAYDNQQTLSLNSCNILIPQIDGLEMKYIMAVLNSRIAQFIFEKQFHSVKVLRSHIEKIPIPMIDQEKQKDIVQKVDSIIGENNPEKIKRMYDMIDMEIAELFALNSKDYSIILKAAEGNNLFLSA